MNAIRQTFLVWAIALIPALASAMFFQLDWNRGGDRITLAEVESWSEPVIWVDARQRDQFEQDHWEEAVLLNLDEWDGLVPDFLMAWNPDARIVIYCDTEACGTSEEVAEKIRTDFGHEAVYVFDGGWETLKELRR